VWLSWPQRYEVRHGDEVGYLCSSLMLVEGLPPSNKPAPAGPQTWVGWVYAYAHIALEMLHPPADSPAMSLKVRPFFAMSRALFDLYHDISRLRQLVAGLNVAVFLAAVAASFAYGKSRAGLPGAVLVGGLAALLPLFVSFAVMSRPYSMAWSLGILAIFTASREKLPQRATYAGILFGLAVGTRIEMLVAAPLLLWDFYDSYAASPDTGQRRASQMMRIILLASLTAYAVAPWLLTGLAGNLRAIGTIQVANPTVGAKAGLTCLKSLVWDNGLGPALALFLAGAVLMVTQPAPAGSTRRRQLILVLIVAGTLVTLLKSTGYGFHHKGPVVVVFLLATAPALAAVARCCGQRWVWSAVGVVLLLPAIQVTRSVFALPRQQVIALADWVESHVPAGRDVYMELGGLKIPLPTPQSADLLWSQVTDDQAWRQKFAAGMTRFGMTLDQLPRAMSEENLVQEHGNRRRWFMLGGTFDPAVPRYVIHLIHPGPVFPVQDADLPAEFARTGGVVLWADAFRGPAPAALGLPLTTINADGDHWLVFSSGDLAANIMRSSGGKP